MARRSAPQPLYQSIVDDVKSRITRRQLTPGDRILSIGEMAKAYNVSAITAKRAISELQSSGWVHSIKGKGSFVAPRTGTRATTLPAEPAPPQAAVESIVLLSSNTEALRVHSFIAEIWESIEQTAAECEVELKVQMLPLNVPENHLDLLLRAEPGEGYLALNVGQLHRILAYLGDRGCPVVAVDAVVAGCHAVASDNLDGMRQVIDHLRGLGHRRLHLSTRDPRSSNCTNENERAAAFRFLCADRGMNCTVGSSEAPETLLRKLGKSDAPTAFLFTRDDPAIAFVLAAGEAGHDVPRRCSVAGFDGYSARYRDFTGLTTLAVDRAGLGRAAVQLLTRDRLPEPYQCDWSRVPGQLRIGTTTGPAPR